MRLNIEQKLIVVRKIMADKNAKKKVRLADRIKQLETELTTTLQKKAAGPAIDVAKYTAQIRELKKQLADLG